MVKLKSSDLRVVDFLKKKEKSLKSLVAAVSFLPVEEMETTWFISATCCQVQFRQLVVAEFNRVSKFKSFRGWIGNRNVCKVL